MARAWIELSRDAGWGDVRLAAHALHELGYATAELRQPRGVLLRVSGADLDVTELWRLPGQMT